MIVTMPTWIEKELSALTDDELLLKAIDENRTFCISPFTYHEIERRFLSMTLQKLINPHVGFRHETIGG